MADKEREHKRIRHACGNCRRKKTRCPGERPICSFCARLGQVCQYDDDYDRDMNTDSMAEILQQNSGLAARVALLEMQLSMLDSGAIKPESSSSSMPGASLSPPTQIAGASHTNHTPNSDLTALLDARMLQSLADVYFRKCHLQPYSYFHEPSFRQAINDESLPYYLILAFAAVTLRFSEEPAFAGRQHEATDFYAKIAWSELVEHSFADAQYLNISAVQAASMLGTVDYNSGRDRLAWVKFGMSIRFAQMLSLGREPDGVLPAPVAEERRRTFWSVYILDRLSSCGRHRPPVIIDSDCTLQLPVNWSVRPISNQGPPTLRSVQEISNETMIHSADHSALTIFMVSVFGDIVRWSFEHSMIDPNLPWSSRSEFSRINGILFSFESYSDVSNYDIGKRLDQFTKNGVINEQKACHFVYAHLLYHLNQCLLHHPFIIRQHLKSCEVKVPPSFLRGAVLKSLEHAIHLTALLRSLQDRQCKTYPGFWGYAAVIAGAIHRLRCNNPNTVDFIDASTDLATCIQFLDQEPTVWQTFPRMKQSGVLKDFDPDSTLAAHLLGVTLDPLPAGVMTEEKLWQICDYGWLTNAARRASTNGGFTRPVVDLPDFDTLLNGAMSFDFTLLE